MTGARARLRLEERFLIASAGDIKSIDVRSCGLDSWFLPVPIIANLPRLKVLQCISESEVKGSKLCLPPAQVCSVGIESIKKFFFQPEQKDLEGAAVSTTLLLSSGATVPREIIDIIMALWHDGSQGLEDAPPMAQQLWVSLVSHQNSDRFAPLVEKFLDKYLDRVSDVMKWKDHSGRTAAATALSSCKRAMLSRSLVMGLYDIPDGLQHEYKSATCTVYLAHRVEGEKRTMVALKFMKNADEFEREKSSRKMLLAPCSGQEQAPQDYIMESTDSYHHENAVFHSSVQKRKWLVDYPNPCLLVMPAADRNLRIIMDNERITNHEAIKSMFHRILRCAKYMHDRGFIHGDLKPRNVMRILHRLVLIDFDASARIGKQYSWSKHSSAYMPPEAIRLQLSLRSVDFAIVDSSDPTRCTVSFTFSLPVAIPIGTTFNVSISPAKVTAVHSFILNGATELHGCINIHDRGITVTSNATLVAAKHSFTLVALFHGQLPAADCMSARLDHFLNTMLPNDGISKDILAECITIIRNPNIDAKLAAAECICSCSIMLRELEHIPDECTGLCGLAHTGHDIWALGVILFRFSARESLFSEDDEDNIKDGSGRLKLALWTDAFKQQRLQKIDDTATRVLVSKLLEKEPWKRPRCISDVLAMPFNEMDVIKLKLQQTVPSDASQSSNLVGSVKDLRTGKFSDAAYGLRPYLKVADDWSEDAACTLQGMQDEVDLLKDCPDCAQVQADVLQQLGRSEAAATQKLASALAELKEQRKKGAKLAAADVVKALRSDISALEGWHYGLPNSISWPTDKLKSGYRTYCQPMCKGCQDYCLDHSSIFADLHYIMHEPAVEKKEWNGIRDHGRAGRRLKDFMTLPQATEALLTEAELAALRFYTSHSFNALNIAMRDSGRQGPHPLPGIMMNMQRGLKKLRALGSNDASSKQTVVLWRGMSYMQLTQQFNAEGGTELAPMSTTTDVSVAISYAVKKDTRSALLFRFVTRNNLERGADVQWLSMFPGESETLFPP
jgi:serine/threonine protein kinase